jgi:hypothetical protein
MNFYPFMKERNIMPSVSEVIIPSNPEDLKQIKSVMKTISDSLTTIEGHRALINDEIKAVSEKFELPTKFIRKMAKTYHKQTINKELQEMEDFERLYTQVLGE